MAAAAAAASLGRVSCRAGVGACETGWVGRLGGRGSSVTPRVCPPTIPGQAARLEAWQRQGIGNVLSWCRMG